MSSIIDENALRTIVAKAMFDTLTETKKEELLNQALTSIITPAKDPYGRSSASIVEQAFRQHVDIEVRNIVRDIIQSDPRVKAKLTEAVTQTIENLLFKDSGKIANALTHSFWKALNGEND
jgi:Lhr-like helicase